MSKSVVIKGGTILNQNGELRADVRIENEKKEVKADYQKQIAEFVREQDGD